MGLSHLLQSLNEEGERGQPQNTDTGADRRVIQIEAVPIEANHEGEEAAEEQADADCRSLVGAPEAVVAANELLTIGNGWRILCGVFGIEQMLQGAGHLLVTLGESEHAGNEESRPQDQKDGSLKKCCDRGQCTRVQTQAQYGLTPQNTEGSDSRYD